MSVTLSGDTEAIQEAKADLNNRQKFARILMVDTAYHSHHMECCAEPYSKSLKSCRILAEPSNDSVLWVSSVYGPAGSPSTDELTGRYWRENMVQAVLFNEALERILIERGPFDAAIEIGPHPALKGPATQTMKSLLGSAIAYKGTLDRTKNDVLAFGDCLAFLSTLPVAASVNLEKYAATFIGSETLPTPRVVKGLPPYSWDHTQRHYRESRLTRQYLNKTVLPHELLGVRTPDDSAQELRWRNILKPSAVPWIKDHRFQGHIILPAAAYCIMALDAARFLTGNQPAQMVEIQDLEIFNAISTEEDSPGVETIFSLRPSETRSSSGSDIIEGSFLLSSTVVDGNLPMRKAVGGRVAIVLGDPRPDVLPLISQNHYKPEMTPVDLEAFYTSMQDIGLGYTGPFRALSSMKRRMNLSTATLEKPHLLDTSDLRVRPALVDVCFQAAFAAFAAPGDGALWTAFLPQKIHRLRFNLALCDVCVEQSQPSQLSVDAYITEFHPATSQTKANFAGDIEVFNGQGQMEIQIEGINVSSLAAQTEDDDRELYLRTVWGLDPASKMVAVTDNEDSVDQELLDSCRRIARFYHSNRLDYQSLTEKTRPSAPDPLLIFVESNPYLREIKSFDTVESIDRLIQDSPNQPLLNSVRVCGEHMPSLVPGVIDYVMREASMFSRINRQLKLLIEQIVHRYPHMNILEIASEETVTASVFESLGSAFMSYTVARVDNPPSSEPSFKVTKISQSKLVRSEFDIHQDALDQGYKAESYDLVIASYTVRKAGSLEDLLGSLHRLIRPGGYLVILDSTIESFKQKLLRCFSSLPPGPDLAPIEWNDALSGARFTDSPQVFQQNEGRLSLVVCQAMNESTKWLRSPLNIKQHDNFMGEVLIVGGKQPEVQAIAQDLTDALAHACWNGQITRADAFEDVMDSSILDTLKAAVILADLDEPVIATMDHAKLNSIQRICSPNRQVLWLVSRSYKDNPYHNASIGMGRCIKAETPQFDLQFLDLDVVQGSGKVAAEAFLRLALANSADLQSQLWTTEHEIAVKDLKLFIPRLLPLKPLNDRLNSIRRVVSREISMAKSTVQIVGVENMGTFSHKAKSLGPISSNRILTSDIVVIKVKLSSLFAVKIGASCSVHVCPGYDTSNWKSVIALSPINSSYIIVPAHCTYPIEVDPENTEDFLGLVVSFLVCQSVPIWGRSGAVILHEPGALIAFALGSLLTASQRLLCFTSDPHHQGEARSNRVYIHPQTTERRLRAVMPPDTVCIMNFSSDDNALSETMKRALSVSNSYFPRSSFFNLIGAGQEKHMALGMEALKEAVSRSAGVLRSRNLPSHGRSVTPVRNIVKNGYRSLLEIVDWTECLTVPEICQQVKPPTVFSNSKTYILVGLAGELGQSLCKLMVTSGVRYLIIMSRQPIREPKWRDELEGMGAKVLIESVDAAKMGDVIRLRDYLTQNMPPVAGIVNGAMVLSDGLFADMSLDSFERVLRPKVEGSKNLDRAFSSVNLDFFIMFSSLTAVAGNRGQSNYAAANMV